MSRISIVIPMFNESRHIARTLRSLERAADAAGLECELIVVDNGSNDEGPQIARQFGAQVLILPGLSIGALRNRGASLARGDWLAFIDADIEMPENWLTLLLELESTAHADIFALDLHTPAEAPWFAKAWQLRTLRPTSHTLHPTQWLPSANLLMRREWFLRVDGFDDSLRTGEDKEFTMRLSDAGARLLAVNESVALHWGYENSWREWMGKEMWRQGSHLQLLRTHGVNLRLLRFPMLSIGAWVLDFMAICALADGLLHCAVLLLLLTSLPPLVLSLRQSLKHHDIRLTLQLWSLHALRLHLAGVALMLSLCHWNARRPARG
ncbi:MULTISPECIES: glycosyltransferase family 2 protein [unclassified Pseudomonas]|uniref:glycosyltransferase family 2 protein n=1 Tax=unclassified Pseudomonas TaxID=196821 RepID=UPI002AC9B936|nr:MULTISPECIES: glycosyltransferase [unclassified Pseudomonas]MEB0048303.1 glycosyltransferase [Pseudomonas sp. Dout3]MEB0099053.1 glycosyltransferase [Pseudomonas sp. DC1.2]WPX56953.1 glycosyltransferase [Pseudomonas sp. DC1.2]